MPYPVYFRPRRRLSGMYQNASFIVPRSSAPANGPKYVPLTAPSLGGYVRDARWNTGMMGPVEWVQENAKWLGLGAIALVVLGGFGRRRRR